VGPTALGITTGTFNLNGHLDLAVTTLGSGSNSGAVYVLHGNGDGTFASATPKTVGTLSLAVAAGTFNKGEAMQDLVFADLFGTLTDPVVVVSTNVFAAPTITSFSPPSGLVGTTVTINGTNFFNIAAVAFNGVATGNFTVNAAGTQITVTVPSGATTGPIGVAAKGGVAVSSTSFTVTNAPSVFQPVAGLAPAAATGDAYFTTISSETEPTPLVSDGVFVEGFSVAENP
jgi:hypothetical protein